MKEKGLRIAAFLVMFFISFGIIIPAEGQTSTANSGQVEPETLLTDFMVQTITMPKRDDYDLYSRLKKVLSPDTPRSKTKKVYQIGDKDTFFVFDLERKQHNKVIATVVSISPHLYMFLDDNFKLNTASLKKAADLFETKIYPTNRRYFGEEPSPGVDNDTHLIILNTPLKLASGYFSSEDALLQSVNSFSNEREMFFISSNPDNLDSYLGTLAHEFQHMIEFNSLPNQDIWLNEGSSVLAQQLNGYSSGSLENLFMTRPTTQLNAWTCSACGPSVHYGAAYTWLSYLNDRFGSEIIRNIISNGKGLTGLNAVDWALAASGNSDTTANSLFSQWVAANYLNKRNQDPLYNYKSISAHINQPTPVSLPYTSGPVNLNQFSSQYYNVSSAEKGFTLDFKGNNVAQIIPDNPHSGKMVWWSNRGDNSDSTLTRDVDLSKVQTASFKFWTWFDIEPRFDYIYIEASTDGITWRPLPGKYTTPLDPASRAFGPALTGQSLPGEPDLSDQEDVKAGWVQENIDLSMFAGKKIKLRLEYVTDEGYNRNGAMFDDFEIPEIGWKDDVEGGSGDWQPAGFARTNNLLPQKFSIQILNQDGACGDIKLSNIAKGDNGQSCIKNLVLDSKNTGRQFFSIKNAVVIIAPTASKTLAPSQFTLVINPGA